MVLVSARYRGFKAMLTMLTVTVTTLGHIFLGVVELLVCRKCILTWCWRDVDEDAEDESEQLGTGEQEEEEEEDDDDDDEDGYAEADEDDEIRFVRARCTHSVSKKSPPKIFWLFFPKWLGIFSPNFTHLLRVPIYARIQIFIQLSAILTKLCHIKRDHPVHTICSECPPSAEAHAGVFCHFPTQLGIFDPYFTHLLHVPIYARLHIFI